MLLIFIFFFCNIQTQNCSYQLDFSFTKTRVRYSETDQMGVVYYGNYAQYFELGRTEWLRSKGITYKFMENNGIMLPVISLKCDFIKPALYDDVLTIKTVLKKKPGVRIEFDLEITNQLDELICTGNTVLVFINMKTNKPTRCPSYILNSLNI